MRMVRYMCAVKPKWRRSNGSDGVREDTRYLRQRAEGWKRTRSPELDGALRLRKTPNPAGVCFLPKQPGRPIRPGAVPRAHTLSQAKKSPSGRQRSVEGGP